MQKIYLIGPMGAGKTTLGKKLSELLCFDFVDTDEMIAAKAGCSIKQIIANFNVAHFRSLEGQVFNDLVKLSNIVVATGGGCILDPKTRNFLSTNGVVCYLKVNVAQQLQRLVGDTQRALLPSESLARQKFLQQMQVTRADLYSSIATVTLDTSTLNVETAAQALFVALSKNYV